jgi:hypothetical protein
MRPTVFLPRAALALLAAGLAAAAPAPAAAQTRVPVDSTDAQRERAREQARERRDAQRDAAREQARERRDAQRDAARERARARRDSLDADREARDDLGLGDIGRVVGEAVREGMRGAAEGVRAASEALRAVERDLDRDYEPDAPDAGPTRIDTTVRVGQSGAVDLTLVTGPVTVTAWNRADVRVRAYSERLPLRFEATGGTVRVYSPRTRTRSAGEQRLEVFVPAGTRVTATSVSGDVSVRGMRGEVDARSTSGDVDVQGGARRVALQSVSGDVRASAVDGDVRAQSVSGDVTLDDVGGEVDAKTTSGGVTLRRARLSRLRAETVSGDVAYDGALARDGRYDLSSHSGEIRLALPAGAGAALSLRTYSGTIDSNVPLTLQPNALSSPAPAGSRSGRRLEFTLGGGGARVTAESFSGSITIAKPR